MSGILVVANWKMNPRTEREAKEMASYSDERGVVVCPPFVFLDMVGKTLKKAELGAQNCFGSPTAGGGPFTGEVSSAMLKDRNCKYVIVGHSERRKPCNEDSSVIKDKIRASLKEKIVPILCVIEEEKEDGALESIRKQLLEILEEEFFKEIIIAYEPVYAIGTGDYCDIEEAEKKKVFIKSVLVKNYKKAKNVPILYGGSVDSKNAKDYIKRGGFDGLLVGTASLKKSEFKKIVERVT